MRLLFSGMKGKFGLSVVGAVIFLIVAGLLGISGYKTFPSTEIHPQSSVSRTIQLRGQTVRVLLADTPETRQMGLSGRGRLAQDEGMLFIFSEDGTYAFWMKDMRFSIDILWLSASDRPSRDGSATATVVYIAPDVSPDTYPQGFVSTKLARYVLELPAGFVRENNVTIGDIVRL